jgi:hypothetical protein
VNCDPLPNTGLDPLLGLFVVISIGCLVLGTMLLLASRRRRRGSAVIAPLMVLAILGAISTFQPGVPAHAETSDCGTAVNSLTVTQTSTMEGLAPGSTPVPITGLVVNNGPDSTYLAAVEVEITSVTIRPGTGAGTCDASDYHLLNTRMPVRRTLGPGGSTPFAGAAIGFTNKSSNQDICQNAVVHLLYTAKPD